MVSRFIRVVSGFIVGFFSLSRARVCFFQSSKLYPRKDVEPPILPFCQAIFLVSTVWFQGLFMSALVLLSLFLSLLFLIPPELILFPEK